MVIFTLYLVTFIDAQFIISSVCTIYLSTGCLVSAVVILTIQ
jgi:hypothetical protein